MRLLVTLSILFALAAAGCENSNVTASTNSDKSSLPVTQAPVGTQTGYRAPAWTLKNIKGETKQLSDYLGEIVVLDFWATWCGPCKRAMPALQDIETKYRERGVHVIGMNYAERNGNEPPKGYLKQNNFTYDCMFDADAAARAYGVQSIPMLYVVGVDGAIIHTHNGFTPGLAQSLSAVLDRHLVENNM